MEANESTQPVQPLGVASTEGLGLVPCPLCGADKGYTLTEGTTYRWWWVSCADCGGEVGECASDRRTHLGSILPDRCDSADEVWNEAGAHAQGLRSEIERLRSSLKAIRSHWREFGPEHGFDETIEMACRVLEA